MKNTHRLLLLSLISLQTACMSGAGTGEQIRITNPQPRPVYTPPSANTYPVEKPPQTQVYRPVPPVYRPVQPQAQVEPLSPAVMALVSESEQYLQSGNLHAASANIERALVIQPRNASLTYKLAVIRLKQQQPQLAEQLAQKSIVLAGYNSSLKRQNWLLIAEARRLQQNYLGADQALMKARNMQ